MKIKIPIEYLTRYPDKKVFISRFPKDSFLFMNNNERDELVGVMNKISNDNTVGILRFFEAGIFECSINDDMVDFPECLNKFVDHKKVIFNLEKQGLLMSINK